MDDPYFDTDNCVERLYQEYLKHGDLLVSVDFDDVLFDFHNKGHKYPKIIEILKECDALDFWITIYTARKSESFDFVLNYMKELGIRDGKLLIDHSLADIRARINESLKV